MTKPVRSQTTLSPKSAAGSTVYNAYYYLTQLSGLYAAGQECAKKPEEKKLWVLLSDSGLEDVGILFSVWEWVLKEIRTNTLKPEVEHHWNMVALACKRMAVIHQGTNFWTPRLQWCRIGLRCESRWVKIITGFEAQDPRLTERMRPLLESSTKRQQHLKSATQKLEDGEKTVNSWFVVDDAGAETLVPSRDHDGIRGSLPPKLKIAGAS
jgi:hypothetical protein